MFVIVAYLSCLPPYTPLSWVSGVSGVLFVQLVSNPQNDGVVADHLFPELNSELLLEIWKSKCPYIKNECKKNQHSS